MRYSLADVSELMFNRPVAITRERAEVILGVMGPRLNIGSVVIAGENREMAIADLAGKASSGWSDYQSRPGDREMQRRDWETGALLDPIEIWNGVGIIKIRGSLMPEGGLNPDSGATAYSGIDLKTRWAEAEARVQGIVLDIDSGGGTIVDMFETCARIQALAAVKPVRAIIRGSACSAAYALAASANEISCAPYSWAGSIGVLIAHADFSKQIEAAGVKVTLLTSGAHKTDGDPTQPLGEEIHQRLQAEVDRAANDFIAHVAQARSSLSPDQIRDQQARFYSGEEALSAGLVDKIMSYDESLTEFAEAVNRRQPPAGNTAHVASTSAHRGATRMETRDDLSPAADNQPAFTQETQAAAVKAAVTAERERIGQLLELDGGSKASEALTAAIGAGTEAGAFAIELQRAARAAQTAALAGARSDAVAAADLPDQRTNDQPGEVNRGQAAVERMRGSHKGLPAKA